VRVQSRLPTLKNPGLVPGFFIGRGREDSNQLLLVWSYAKAYSGLLALRLAVRAGGADSSPITVDFYELQGSSGLQRARACGTLLSCA
ncbi:MAG: hypothetical protein ACREVL_17065, partial [Solimonas sp.]